MNFSCNTEEKKQGKTDQCRLDKRRKGTFGYQTICLPVFFVANHYKPVPNPATANW